MPTEAGNEETGAHPVPAPLLRRYAVLLTLALTVLIVDQAVKAVVAANLKRGGVVEVLGGAVRIDYTSNSGGAFSMFPHGGAVFTVIAILVCLAIIVAYRRFAYSPLVVRSALGLILGGACGNVMDRIRLGYVVDFIDLRWWPVFNLADSAVVLSVALLILHSVAGASSREAA